MATDDDTDWTTHGDDRDYPFDDDDVYDCYWCGGAGVKECPNLLECTSPHNAFGECPCGSCGGSGLAKDMTIW